MIVVIKNNFHIPLRKHLYKKLKTFIFLLYSQSYLLDILLISKSIASNYLVKIKIYFINRYNP